MAACEISMAGVYGAPHLALAKYAAAALSQLWRGKSG
jgi:hypothetical protein